MASSPVSSPVRSGLKNSHLLKSEFGTIFFLLSASHATIERQSCVLKPLDPDLAVENLGNIYKVLIYFYGGLFRSGSINSISPASGSSVRKAADRENLKRTCQVTQKYNTKRYKANAISRR